MREDYYDKKFNIYLHFKNIPFTSRPTRKSVFKFKRVRTQNFQVCFISLWWNNRSQGRRRLFSSSSSAWGLVVYFECSTLEIGILPSLLSWPWNLTNWSGLFEVSARWKKRQTLQAALENNDIFIVSVTCLPKFPVKYVLSMQRNFFINNYQL